MNSFLSQFESLVIPNLGYIKLPKYDITLEDRVKYHLSEDADSADFLLSLINDGFEVMLGNGTIPKDKKEQYQQRLTHEYETFKNLFFIDYVLLIFSIVDFCKRNDIMNSPARGSCGGSLAFYVIGLIGIDPIKHDLLFERFISASRTQTKIINGETYLASENLPDVDLDSDVIHKPLINKFLESRFPHRTCRIINLLTLQSKLAIKEMGKIVGNKSDEEMTRITSMITNLFGKNETLVEAYDETPEFKQWCDENKLAYETALKVEGLIKTKSIHASGIFISNEILDNTIPTELSTDKAIATSYDMSGCGLLGLKVDNLGLKNLSTINYCLKLIGKTITELDLNDPAIYQFLCSSKNYCGVFQCEEGLGKEVMSKVQPKNLDDIISAIALSRPGCYKFVDEFVRNKTNGEFDFHPRLNHIVSKSHGCIIVQEEIMKICVEMAQFSPAESNDVRSAIGKKKMEKMKSYKERFIKQSIENNFEKDFACNVWQVFEDSGNYLFCGSHACGYGYLTAITTFLKVKYTREYFLSLLMHTKHEGDAITEISKIHKEMSHFGLKLLPPSLATSKIDFSIEDNNIRFGLSSIKGVAEKTIEKLNNFKREHSNKFELFEAAKEAGLSIGIVSALIQAGTLDKFGKTRTLLVYEAQLWNKLTPKEKQLAKNLGERFGYSLAKIVRAMNKELKTEKSKPLIKDSRMETLKKATKTYKAIYEQNSICESFANWWYEKRLLGYVTYTTLLDIFRSKKPSLIPIHEALEEPEGQRVDFVGFVEEDPTLATSRTASKSKYAKYYISDEGATAKVMIFNDALERCKELNVKLPKEEEIVIVSGTKREGDCFFANTISSQKNQIYQNLLDLKDSEFPESP